MVKSNKGTKLLLYIFVGAVAIYLLPPVAHDYVNVRRLRFSQ